MKGMFGEIAEVSVKELMVDDHNRGFVIPAFQRGFSWKKENFKRFFNDVVLDLNDASNSADITFIGNIICTQDIESLSDSLRRRPRPTEILQVVDGQQRLTFLAMLATALHEYLHLRTTDCAWLSGVVEDLKKKLIRILLVDLVGVDIKSPALVREYSDSWKSSPSIEMRSPAAWLLDKYCTYEQEGRGPFKYSRPKHVALDSKEHRNFASHRKTILTLLNSSCDDNDSINLATLFEKTELHKHLFGSRIKDAVEAEIAPSTTNKEILRAAAFGNYVLKSMKAILIRMNTPMDKTFVVFDSLNTTGCTLNAYESFRPEVFRHNKADYQNCVDKRYLDNIDADLATVDGRIRDRHVSDLIIAFSLAYTGLQMGRHIHKQRTYLKNNYSLDNYKNATELLRFFDIANQMLIIFSGKSGAKSMEQVCKGVESDLVEKASFFLCHLQKANFSVALSLLARYLQNINEQNDKKARELFCRAVLSTTAFFMLWRSSRETTDGVDGIFRSLIINKLIGDDGKFFLPDIDQLNTMYINILREQGGINSQSEWADKASEVALDKARQVAKFILLTGTHNTVVESKNGRPVIIKKNSGIQTITSSSCDNVAFSSIEHIVARAHNKPQTHQLWNLTLLPISINSILQDKNWEDKHPYYSLLSLQNKDEGSRLLKDLRSNLSEAQRKKLDKFLQENGKRFLHMTKYLALLPSDEDFFNKETGKDRIDKILEYSWQETAQKWLEWPSETSGGTR